MVSQLKDFTGPSIYLDTMIPYLLLRGIEEEVKRFFLRIERGEFVAYTSILTFDELAYRLLLAFIKDRYEGSPLNHLRSRETELMVEFSEKIANLLLRFRELPHLVILDVLHTDLKALAEGMIKHQLRPRDALHLAAMQRVGCFDLASNDAHFDNVPFIRRYEL
ncbi:MAG TPA: PIN domain-containing protein [Anaerolineae bacterium]|nr:PIN domain-containing protein [Anaerolineae bacterium]